MPESLEQMIQTAIKAAQADGSLASFEVSDLGMERPADASNGDWTSTVAMRSAKLAHCAPRQIAEAIIAHLPASSEIEKVEVAGPGFINFYLSAASNNQIFADVREQGADFGRSNLGAQQKVQVEFVSANPVGPMHVGHGRWAALGDSLCRVLDFAGYDVEREYYINDHGSQMDVFGSSVDARYQQLAERMSAGDTLDEAYAALVADRDAFVADEADEHPEAHPLQDSFNEALGGNAYGGTYIIDIARHYLESDGTVHVTETPEQRLEYFRESGYKLMLENIRKTLAAARCEFDVWFSERSLYVEDADGTTAVSRAFARLSDQGYLYTTDDGALWFRSTDFGDDKDRVLIKSDGDMTYFASDVAYHWDKFQRVDHVIDIWGADHHGYIKRVDSACAALGYPDGLEVLLGQLVNLLRAGEPVRMSKRKGVMVTFDELLGEVGCDAVRYLLVAKSANQTIDFDIEAAKKRSADNPVYYVQYAHARICSILRRAAGVEDAADGLSADECALRAIGETVDLSLLTDPAEERLARKLAEFSSLVEGAARDRAPFRLTHYAEELAATFHGFYTNCQVLPGRGTEVAPELSRARLAACDAVRIVLEITLGLIGVSAPEQM